MPPRRFGEWDRPERQHVTGVRPAGARQRIRDCRFAGNGGDRKAAGIQTIVRQLGARPRAANADCGSYGIHCVLHRAIALPFDCGRLRAHDIGERCDAVAAQIDHTSAGGVPQGRRVPFHVGVESERHEAPVGCAKIERRRRAPRGLSVGIFAGLQALVPRVRSGILLG